MLVAEMLATLLLALAAGTTQVRVARLAPLRPESAALTERSALACTGVHASWTRRLPGGWRSSGPGQLAEQGGSR